MDFGLFDAVTFRPTAAVQTLDRYHENGSDE